MGSNLIHAIEPYLGTLYIVHIFISVVLAILLTFYTMKRFTRKTEEIESKDRARLEEIVNKNIVFRTLFKVSLHKNNRVTSFLFMFLFNFSMPFVGYAFSIWVTLYLKHIKYEKVVAHTNILNLDEFGTSFLKVERIFGEGSMIELLDSEYASKSKKLKALSALANNATPANLKIIRHTLSSTDDEIRMFGYAIINKAEKSLNVKINTQLEKFNEAKIFLSMMDEDDWKNKREKRYNKYDKRYKESMAEASKELAHLYWEMVYTELSHESLKEEFLKEVVKYLKIAKEYYRGSIDKLENSVISHESKMKELDVLAELTQEDKELLASYRQDVEDTKQKAHSQKDSITKLYVLMGRVHMSRKEYDYANTEFTIAQELHTTYSSFILPYLAEIHFLTGNYKVVNSIMSEAKDLGVNATLHPIVEQWKAS